MLTREQCLKLRDAGMEQTLDFGDRYYAVDGYTNVHPGPTGWSGKACLKIPSTDELMEFVLHAAQAQCDRTSTVALIKDVRGGCEAFIDNYDGDVLWDALSDDLSAALYALFEKMTGGAAR